MVAFEMPKYKKIIILRSVICHFSGYFTVFLDKYVQAL